MDQIYNKDLLNEIKFLQARQEDLMDKLRNIEKHIYELASATYVYGKVQNKTEYTSTPTK